MDVPAGHHFVEFGTTTFDYELVYRDRKSLAIHVYPDTSVVVEAPHGSAFEEIEARVRHRAGWITKRQQEFRDYASDPLPRQYVSGETYRYLGRQYRLKVAESAVERVRLDRGYFYVEVNDKTNTRRIGELVENWYRHRAKIVFQERIDACFPRLEALGIPRPILAVRIMKTRWGSCSASARITLNLRLLQVPKYLIDYVVIHELVHLKEHNHSSRFYALMDGYLPRWRELRETLNRYELT